MEETDIQRLKQVISRLSPGPVALDGQPELLRLLEECWHLFDGSDDEAMAAYKLARAEDLYWHPPFLTFAIERHGGTSLGSTRAELQGWTLDLEHMIAKCEKIGYRQMYPKQAPFDVKPIARELCEAIISGSRDERLDWARSGAVRVLTGRILPESSERTLEGRRKRLRKAIGGLLAPHGWQSSGAWWKPEKR
jgi:hypothetical protein